MLANQRFYCLESETSLSEAMRDTFSSSESNRIKRFYCDRFGASADNLVSAFQGQFFYARLIRFCKAKAHSLVAGEARWDICVRVYSYTRISAECPDS